MDKRRNCSAASGRVQPRRRRMVWDLETIEFLHIWPCEDTKSSGASMALDKESDEKRS